MAQRTGDLGFITPRAKVASARVILALATALALAALSGCGGGSDDPPASGSSSQAGTTSASTDGAPSSQQGGAASGQPSSKEQQEQEEGPAGANPSSSGQTATKGGKHGPHIAIPKGPQEPEPTQKQRAQSTVASIALESPALGAPSQGSSAQTLPATYTCDGRGSWPELRWSGVPEGTAELILFAMSLEPVNEAIFFDWALAGIDPKLEGIEAAKLPKGAVSGRNGFGKAGYEICPAKGKAETYVFALYALPKALSPRPGFDPSPLREEVLDQSGNAGLLAVSYSRAG